MFSSKFPEDNRLQQTPEEGWRVKQSKCCEFNIQDEKNSSNVKA